MSPSDKNFGNNSNAPNATTPTLVNAAAHSDPNVIHRFDEYGRELLFPKEQWRTQVLPDAIRAQWENPAQLYDVIAAALNEGLIADVLDAAERLHSIDPVPARGACAHGVVLMKNMHVDAAERVFLEYLQQYGDEAAILGNLATIYANRKDTQKAEETLWRALELDPNLEYGLNWYEALQRTRFGEEARLNALRRVARLPGSWRAQIRLALDALRSRDLGQALTYYREGLSGLGKNVPADFLAHMSCDLGSHGHVTELLELTGPCYQIETHGIEVGNNLIKAHLDLGELDSARRLVDGLYRLKRAAWRQTLDYWDAEIRKAWVMSSAAKPDEPAQMELLVVDGPVWLEPLAPTTALFAAKQQRGATIVFVGSSAEGPEISSDAQPRLEDDLGRLSRALPLFLAEQVYFAIQARVKTLIPWSSGDVGMFLLGSADWPDQKAARCARGSGVEGDYVVITHLKSQTNPWTVELRLVRTNDGKCIGNLRSFFTFAAPGDAIRQFARQLLALLAERLSAEPEAPSPLYQLPNSACFTSYLLRLEQLLGLRCSARDRVRGAGGERKVIETSFQVCRACPENVPLRIVLVHTLLAAKTIKPAILQEYSERIMLLQKEFPLDGPAHGVVQDMLIEMGVA
ncbi:MAG: hypothetical protein V7642_7006 [Burkholderiales bacterium]|jgi:tetratricopeptide (TPR) repeat protein